MYRISEESRRAGLACLYSAPDGPNHPVLLQNAQLKALRALNCWPGVDQPIEWYAGSALINALALIDGLGSSALELYECLPETRRILRSVLVEARPPIPVSVLPTVEQSQTFDGEVHIKGAIAGWSKQDLILLDPFAMWRQAEHQAQRDRYGAIIDGLIAHASEAPSLILFWTWGRNYPSAESDLDGTAEPVKIYAELREAPPGRISDRSGKVAVGVSICDVGRRARGPPSGSSGRHRFALPHPDGPPDSEWIQRASALSAGRTPLSDRSVARHNQVGPFERRSAQKIIVIAVAADPEPQDAIRGIDSHGAVMQADTARTNICRPS